jgi:hypothetical protein
MRRFRTLGCLLVAAAALGAAPLLAAAQDEARITAPPSDGLVATRSIRVEGMLRDMAGNPVDGQVQLRVNGTALPWVDTVAGRYVYEDVALAVGVNVFDGTTRRMASGTAVAGQIPATRLQLRTDLVDRGSQPYFLDFRDPGYAQQARDFISLTVDTPLSPAQLDALVEQVNDQVRKRFRETFELQGLRISEVREPGPGVTRVLFDGTNPSRDGRFGEAPLDFRNQNMQQTGRIFVVNIRRSFVDNNQLLVATPARRTDTPEVRAMDLGNILAKAGVHEFGHTLGLVAAGMNGLDGCNGAHNCEPFEMANPLVNRFELGRFIMDARRSAAADFGSLSAQRRVEFFPVYNQFNSGYLQIIH